MAEAESELRKGLGLLSSLPNGSLRHEPTSICRSRSEMRYWPRRDTLHPSLATCLIVRACQLCEKLNRPQQLNQVLTGQFLFRPAPRGTGTC